MATLTLRFRSSSLVCNDPDFGASAWITCGPCTLDLYVFLVVILVCSMQSGCYAVPVWVHASPGSGVQVLLRKFVYHKEIPSSYLVQLLNPRNLLQSSFAPGEQTSAHLHSISLLALKGLSG
ncbi:hypothetical protein MTO96_047974 [Rhipicephalus appendiculatus]